MSILIRLLLLSVILVMQVNSAIAADAPLLPLPNPDTISGPRAATIPPLPAVPPLPNSPSSEPVSSVPALPALPQPPSTELSPPTNVAAPVVAKSEPKTKGKSSNIHAHKKISETPVLAGSSFIKDRLPLVIYKKSYDKMNRHLPVAFYERDYDALVFVTAAHDDLNGLRALLNTGRSVEMVNDSGDTPLLVAVKHNAVNTARLLLALHANPNVTDVRGMTPLQIATKIGNYQITGALQEMGAHSVQAGLQ